VQTFQSNNIIENQVNNGLNYSHPPKFIGLDVLIDEKLKPHLMEVEQYPGLIGLSQHTFLNKKFKQDLMALLSTPLLDADDKSIQKLNHKKWLQMENKALKRQPFNFELISI